MRVLVNPNICQGHAMCILACPEIFDLSDEDGHAFVTQDVVPEELESNVRHAQQSCPEQAIEIID